ncbi:hypothetical protein CERSUDRAFT_99994 [Gelatoporia subvermispora B]|uniref:Uncharacterized protein n=1 Tax=Ceriporiopsis subvermispora (strain B) TaxID=914234 RepID=M2Q4M9_CERS8|nr:hypothetical protein CERSUDRAFT_99994 [Gelatoporia subvermispora B]
MACPTKSNSSSVTIDDLETVVASITDLCKSLPDTVLDGTRDDKITHVITSVEEDTQWETFNRRLEHGMKLVTNYLGIIIGEDAMRLFYELMFNKLQRLEADLQKIRAKPAGTPSAASQVANEAPMVFVQVVPYLDETMPCSETEHPRKNAPTRKDAPIDPKTRECLGLIAQDVMEKACGIAKPKKPKGKGRPKQKAKSINTVQALAYNDLSGQEKDKVYQDKPVQRERSGSESTVPGLHLDVDSLESVLDTQSSEEESADELTESSLSVEEVDGNKIKSKRKATTASQAAKKPEVIGISSESESDGNSAMRKVNEHDTAVERRHEAGTHGSLNHTLQHWHQPRAAQNKLGQKHWVFACHYCKAQRSVKRTGSAATFQDQHPKPNLGNLSTHSRNDHPSKTGDAHTSDNATDIVSSNESANITWANDLNSHGSRQLMDKFLADSLKNPQIEPTKEGFQTMFALWVFDDDLPFTMGDSGGLSLVKELALVKSRIAYSTDMWTTP